MKTNIPHLLITLFLGAMLSSCVNIKPLATLLPPASKPHVAVVPSEATYKERGISYTDAGLQAGNMYGPLGMLVGATMRSVTLSHNAAFSKIWVKSGKNASNIILNEFQQELARNGYILDPASPNKLKIAPGGGMTTCDRPNARASKKNYFAHCMLRVSATTPAGTIYYPPFMLTCTSKTAFTFETVTVESYEAALREAASQAARNVIQGLKPAPAAAATAN
ncbi:MAG: hypothetical protein IPK32_24065 [Verrucomicrobiaceae bacterium]|nr:hypothetical protein [Verrucomicrobiaceae bacterium]